MDVEKKRQQERKTLREMMKIYCRGHHHACGKGAELCPDCRDIAAYADTRIAKCPRMAVKSFCSVCPIHCYAKRQRERILEVMRYAGPRMLLHHPIMTIRHVFIQWQARRGRQEEVTDTSRKRKFQL